MEEKSAVIYSPSEAELHDGAGFWSSEEGWSHFDAATQFPTSLRGPLSFPKSVMSDAGWVGVDSILYLALAKRHSENVELKYKLDQLDDQYAEKVIEGHPELFDVIEINGCREVHVPGERYGAGCIETCIHNPQFFSVYIHRVDGGVDCVGDFGRHNKASSYAKTLSEHYGWPICDRSHYIAADSPSVLEVA